MRRDAHYSPFSTASIERKRMALIDRHATSLSMAASETVWTFDKVGWDYVLAI